MILKGQKVSAGKAEGEALVSTEGISFYGGVEPEIGKIVEQGHPLEGKSVSGKILVFPEGKGSTVGSYTLYQMKKFGTAPAAIVNKQAETIVAVGAIISEIPAVHKIDIERIENGTMLRVDGDKGEVEIK